MERVKKVSESRTEQTYLIMNRHINYQRIWQAVRRAVNGVDRRAGRRCGKETF